MMNVTGLVIYVTVTVTLSYHTKKDIKSSRIIIL